MYKLDVLLINLPITSWYRDKMAEKNSMPPLGILYIASYLKKYDYSVKVIDLSVEKMTAVEIRTMLQEFHPKIIGMSTYNETWKAQKELCKIVRSVLNDTYIIAGGAFATFCYKDVLETTCTDYVIMGEGEETFLELCNYLFGRDTKDIADCRGVCYRDPNGQICKNEKNSRIIDLDQLPYPERDLLKMEKYTMPFTISTSRGCPGNCIFCSSKAFWGRRVIFRSAKSVFDEVMFMNQKYGANIFSIVDDTFTASKKRCFDFCEMLNNSGKHFIWECESRADVADEILIKTLYEAGCRKIQFGMESADNEILKKLKKQVTIEQIENAVKNAYKYDMHIQVSYIIGHAFDTEATIKKTFKFAKYLKEEYGVRAVCSVNTPFPGTEQYNNREKLGITIKETEWDKYVLSNPIISTNNLSVEQLRKYLAEGLELI